MLSSLPSLPDLSAMPSKIPPLWDHFSPNPTSAIILDDLNISMNLSIALAKTSYGTIYGNTRTTFWPTQCIQMSNLGCKLTWQREQGRKCGWAKQANRTVSMRQVAMTAVELTESVREGDKREWRPFRRRQPVSAPAGCAAWERKFFKKIEIQDF